MAENSGITLAKAWVTVIPTTEGAEQAITQSLTGAGAAAGASAGKAAGSAANVGIAAGIGKFAKTAAGAVAKGGVIAAAAGVVAEKTIQPFIDAYSDYEQLSGGVEKIFDEMDQSAIFADAQSAYKDLNMSANDYLAAITQTGAAFAATMGDEAGYETARQGMLSVADFASGTGRNLDELNDKYALITRSTSSYQSIADQFSGVLPATSEGFLQAAQAAGYLDASYTKLSEVPIDEYQRAVTNVMTDGVAAMGLAGNAAAESSETIAGSTAAASAAWDNWLTSIASGENVGESTKGLASSVGDAVENITSTTVDTIGNLFSSLPELVATVGPEILRGLGEGLAPVGAALDEWAGGLAASLGLDWEQIKTDAANLWQGIGDTLQTEWQGLQDAAGPIFAGIGSDIDQAWQDISTGAGEMWQGTIAPALNTVWTGIGADGEQIWTGLGPMIQGVWDGISTDAGAKWSNIGSALGTKWAEISGDGEVHFDELGDYIGTATATVASELGIDWSGIKAGLDTTWGNISGAADSAWQGIQGFIEDPMGTASDTLGGIFTSLANNLGITWDSTGSDANEKWLTLQGFMEDPMGAAQGTIQTIADTLSGIIGGLDLNLPHFALPHFNVSGGEFPWGIAGQGYPPSFSVDWYARGGFIGEATVIGVGEAGPEMVLPRSGSMMDQFGATVASYVAAAGSTINVVINGNVDSTDTAEYLARQVGLQVSRSMAYSM